MMFSHLLKELNFDTSISINTAAQDMERSFEKSLFKKIGTHPQYENNLTKEIGESKKQIIKVFNQYPLYARNILTVVNSMTLSHLQGELSFVSSMSINAAVQDMGTRSFKKTETSSKYEDNLTKQIGVRKQHLVKVLNQYPLYARNILSVIKPLKLSYLQKTFNFDFFSLKHDQITVNTKKMDEASKNTGLTTQEMDTLYFSKKDNDSHYQNNLTKQIGERTKKIVNSLNQFSLFTRNTSVLVNPATFGYLHKAFNFEFPNLQHGQIVVSKKETDEASKNIELAAQEMDTPYFSKKDNDSHYQNNLTKEIGESKKQIIKVLNQYPPYARNILTVVNSVMLSHLQGELNFLSLTSTTPAIQDVGILSFKETEKDSQHKRNIVVLVNPVTPGYLQRTLNFQFSRLKYGEIVLSKKIMDKTSKNAGLATQKMGTPSFSKKDNGSHYETNLTKQTGERKKQFVKVLNQYSLFARNILTVANSVTLSHLQKTFYFEFSSLGHGQASVNVKELINSSMSINAAIHSVDMPSIPSINSVIPGYVHNKNIDILSLETNRMISAAKKIEIHPVREFVNSQSADTLSLQQVGVSKNDENNAPGQIKEGKDQLITNLFNPYLSAKAILTSVNLVTLRYLQRAFNFKTVNSRLYRVFSSTKDIDKASTIVFSTHQGIDLSPSQQTINIRDLQYRYLFNHDTNLTERSEVSAFRNRRLPRGSINLSHDNVFSNPLINFEYPYRFNKKNILSEVNNDTIYESNELVLKKPSPQKTEVFSENKGEAQNENISSSKIHYNLGKELTREKPTHEIDIIADRVYKIIERRISIEKDRRGLF